MSEILYTGTLSGSDLTQLISDCNFQRDALFLGEQLPTHIVDEAEQQNLLLFDWYSSAIEFTRYNSGRIFYQGANSVGSVTPINFASSIWEVHNQQPSWNTINVKHTTNVQTSPNDQEFHQKRKHYVLYGSFLNRGISAPEKSVPYAEARIPRILYYPFDLQQADQLKRLSICVREYIYAESGQIFTYRFQSLDVIKPTILN